MEKPKRKGMLDLIKADGAGESVQAGLDEARKIADRVVSFKPKDTTKKRSAIVSPKDHHNTATVSSQEQYGNDILSPLEQDHISITKVSPSNQKVSLPKQSTMVYDWFLKRGFKGTFNKGLIVRETNIPYITIRKSINKLIKSNILRVSYDMSLKQFDYEISTEIEVKRSSVVSGSYQDRSKIISSSYIEEEDIYNLLLLEKFHLMYPSLHNIGFERAQIQDVVQSWKLNSIDLKDLPESFQRAEYAVENKSFKMNDPLNYVYSALMKGVFRKPPGYKSRAEIQAEERLAEQKQILEKNNEAFQLWCENLSPDKRDELCKGIPKIKQSVHLRAIFDNNKDQDESRI